MENTLIVNYFFSKLDFFLLRSLLLGRGKRESRMEPEISAVNQIELEAAQEKIKSDFF